MWVGLVVSVCAGWWSLSDEIEAPIVTVAVSNDGAVFTPWASEDAGGAWDGREDQRAPDCEWWNGTYYYSPSLCSHMSVTRMPAALAQQAIERATRCAAHGDTDCVLSGEIGLNLPAAFVYDKDQGMRMVLAPRLLEVEGAEQHAGHRIRERNKRRRYGRERRLLCGRCAHVWQCRHASKRSYNRLP